MKIISFSLRIVKFYWHVLFLPGVRTKIVFMVVVLLVPMMLSVLQVAAELI